MELRIKEGNGYVDADWTIENGVMVVSPKEVFKPKNGDVIVCSNNLGYWTLIVREMEPYNIVRHHAVLIDNGSLKINDRSSFTNPRPATEEEKKRLFDKLSEEGLAWDAEKKELVKLKWKPKEGELYFLPRFDVSGFHVRSFEWEDTSVEDKYYENGWIYQTREECQEFCDKLNQAINQVKP